jgi:hypothetical protein
VLQLPRPRVIPKAAGQTAHRVRKAPRVMRDSALRPAKRRQRKTDGQLFAPLIVTSWSRLHDKNAQVLTKAIALKPM